MNQVRSRALFELLAAAAIGAAGIIHFIVAPEHWEHAPAHGLFFIVVGVIELVWAVAIVWRPTLRLMQTGALLAGALIILWLITRALPAPFGHGPEEIDAGGLVCKLSELVGLVSAVIVIFRHVITDRGALAARRSLSVLMVVMILLGSTGYIVGRAIEPLAPQLGASTEEHHDHEAP